ncbi:MAG TPA: M13-type metalloendopeptidase, partial [Parvularculaceae bacterium]|nr:M13-type metalloendopeptidase [Parvularculaceae bacterium]
EATSGGEAPVIDGLTGDQRFFLAWAQVWQGKYREDELLQRLETDPHSPPYFRINGPVRNLDAWYEAFGVTPEDDLYLPPEERVRIW